MTAKGIVTQIAQMDIFELLENQDNAYSHFVELYDNIPKFVATGKKRYYEYSDGVTSKTTEFEFPYQDRKQRFIVTIKPGRITKVINGEEREVLVFPSTQREEPIYDALRKIACSGHGGFYKDELATQFTFKAIQKELKRFNKTMSLDEVKECLLVLRSAQMEVKTIDKSNVWLPSYLSNMGLSTRRHFETQGADAKCLVLFDSMVSSAVKNIDFREYNYLIAQKVKHPIARYLTKRIDRRYKQASDTEPYTIKMSTIFAGVFLSLDKKMSNNTRKITAAMEELKRERRISHYHAEPMKDWLDSRVIRDYKYHLFPHQDLVTDMMRFHAKKTISKQRKALL